MQKYKSFLRAKVKWKKLIQICNYVILYEINSKETPTERETDNQRAIITHLQL